MLFFLNFTLFATTTLDSILNARKTAGSIMETQEDIPKFWLIEDLWEFLKELNLSDSAANTLSFLGACIVISLALWVIIKVLQLISLYLIKRTVLHSKSKADDILLKHKFFDRIFQLIPLLILSSLVEKIFAGFSGRLISSTQMFTHALIVLVTLRIIFSLFDSWNEIYLIKSRTRGRSIKGYLQVAKIILSIIAGILILAILLDKDPTTLFVGLGATAALMSLVFKDTILGFVASIQLAAQDMIRIGDWIEMPSKHADGVVTDININSIKVQNWDNTVTMIPIYSMVSDAFTNWRGMQESGGRRFVKGFFFNATSVRVIDGEQIEKLAESHINPEHFKAVLNSAKESSPQGKISNMALLRADTELFLINHPLVNSELIFSVKYHEEVPTKDGIGFKASAFTYGKSAAESEEFQKIFVEYIIVIAEFYELELYKGLSKTIITTGVIGIPVATND